MNSTALVVYSNAKKKGCNNLYVCIVFYFFSYLLLIIILFG